MTEGMTEQLRRLRLERDLYLGLLNLDEATLPEQFIEQALRLVVQIIGAERGYLELTEPNSTSDKDWWTAAGWSDEEVEGIRSTISRGIIAHAIARGEVLCVPSALLDPRFRDRQSVKRSKIEAVLCVPIGNDPPVGVLYLQGSRDDSPFSDSEQELAKTFARYLVGLARRVFQRLTTPDPLSQLRERMNLTGVIGQSTALAVVVGEAELAARLDATVLITGDTGTGKTQLARVIHDNSSRAKRPFVSLNCAAIPESLLENELFGAAPGAHSTAARAIEGKVTAAKGGTLFLDEISELSVKAQAKLLQLLQTKEYYPLGAARPLLADVRVIAATNANLQEMIAAKRFREDLFYRLQVITLKMPSLRNRWEDIESLSVYFCQRACDEHKLPQMAFTPGALAALKAKEWPGNVRELQHFVEAGVMRAVMKNSALVDAATLFPDADLSDVDESAAMTFHEETRRFQKELLQRVLKETDWNITQTARRLDLARAHVYNLIKSFGLSRRTR